MRRQDKYPNHEHFTYYNANPKNRITGDCVYRAIAKATKRSWEDTVMGLAKKSIETGYGLSRPENYGKYLEDLGFMKQKQPRYDDGTKYTLLQFILKHKRGTYVVNMPGHLTVVVNGKNYDIFDCSKSRKKIGNYWEKK